MARLFIQGIVLIVAAALAADAAVVVVVGRRKRSTEMMHMQGVPNDCQVEIDVAKPGESVVDFVVCLKDGEVCTSKDVDPCSSVAQGCSSFTPPADEDFAEMFPNAYAEVCMEPSSGELCLYTDVEYETCSEAKAMNDNEICITLSNGEQECAEIPEERLLKYQSMYNGHVRVNGAKSSESDDDKLPQYRPLRRHQ